MLDLKTSTSKDKKLMNFFQLELEKTLTVQSLISCVNLEDDAERQRSDLWSFKVFKGLYLPMPYIYIVL